MTKWAPGSRLGKQKKADNHAKESQTGSMYRIVEPGQLNVIEVVNDQFANIINNRTHPKKAAVLLCSSCGEKIILYNERLGRTGEVYHTVDESLNVRIRPFDKFKICLWPRWNFYTHHNLAVQAIIEGARWGFSRVLTGATDLWSLLVVSEPQAVLGDKPFFKNYARKVGQKNLGNKVHSLDEEYIGLWRRLQSNPGQVCWLTDAQIIRNCSKHLLINSGYWQFKLRFAL